MKVAIFGQYYQNDTRPIIRDIFVFFNNKVELFIEKEFLDLCEKEGMIGVKGYRTVGGIRVSMYNAMPIASVQTFCDLMKSFC